MFRGTEALAERNSNSRLRYLRRLSKMSYQRTFANLHDPYKVSYIITSTGTFGLNPLVRTICLVPQSL